MKSRHAVLTGALAAAITAAIVVSLIEGAPRRLPGVALGSAVLLHLELFAVSVAIVSVLAQATRGHLPTQLSTGGLSYAADAEAADDAKAAIETLQGQVDELREQVTTLVDATLANPGGQR